MKHAYKANNCLFPHDKTRRENITLFPTAQHSYTYMHPPTNTHQYI